MGPELRLHSRQFVLARRLHYVGPDWARGCRRRLCAQPGPSHADCQVLEICKFLCLLQIGYPLPYPQTASADLIWPLITKIAVLAILKPRRLQRQPTTYGET